LHVDMLDEDEIGCMEAAIQAGYVDTTDQNG
jgi:hypothetical protein